MRWLVPKKRSDGQGGRLYITHIRSEATKLALDCGGFGLVVLGGVAPGHRSCRSLRRTRAPRRTLTPTRARSVERAQPSEERRSTAFCCAEGQRMSNSAFYSSRQLKHSSRRQLRHSRAWALSSRQLTHSRADNLGTLRAGTLEPTTQALSGALEPPTGTLEPLCSSPAAWP
jgi:hypothetical protein